MINTWEYNIRNWYPDEGETLIGNGFLGGSLPRDGHGAAGNPHAGVVVGLYTGENEEPVTIPHWLHAPLKVNDRPVALSWVGFNQILDLRAGAFRTAYTDVTKSVRVEVETFVHRRERSVCAYHLSVQALKDVSIQLMPQLNTQACRPTPACTIEIADCPQAASWLLSYGTGASVTNVAQAILVRCEGRFEVEPITTTGNAIGQTISAQLQTGDIIALDVTVLTFCGETARESLSLQLPVATEWNYQHLRAGHVAAMTELWGAFDVECDDAYLARRAKSSLFYLLCGYRADVIHGGSAGGVSSKWAWGGSVFWDTEFYMFPPLLLFAPRLARNMLLYRHETLPAARANAAAKSEAGARFAWQSKLTGKPLAGPFEDERHVGTDIAFSAWWYGHVSGDGDFIAGIGSELIREVAINVASRMMHNVTMDRYEIHGVIPPDEHVLDHYVGQPINNSAMTNAYAKWVLLQACEMDLARDEAESRNWRKIAARIFLPRDETHNIFAEYEGYSGHPIKQADVGHLFFPLSTPASPDEICRNIYYYADRERETGLFLLHSPCVYAAALNRAGDAPGVGRFLELSARFSVGPFEVPRESNYGGPPVVTG